MRLGLQIHSAARSHGHRIDASADERGPAASASERAAAGHPASGLAFQETRQQFKQLYHLSDQPARQATARSSQDRLGSLQPYQDLSWPTAQG